MGKHSKPSKRRQHKKKNSYRHKNRKIERQSLIQSNHTISKANITAKTNCLDVNETTCKNVPTHLKESKPKSSGRRKKHVKKTFKLKTFILLLLEIIAVCSIIYSGYRIYIWYQDSSNLEQEINKISDNTNVQEINDTENVTVVESDEDKENPYWDYIKMKLIDVDFSELEKTNSDVVRLDTSKRNKH